MARTVKHRSLGTPFPSDVEGTEKQKEDAVWKVTQQIKRRLELFWSLPFDKLDALTREDHEGNRPERVSRLIGTDPALLLKPRTRSNRQDYSEQH